MLDQPEKRHCSAAALGNLGDQRAVDPLIDHLWYGDQLNRDAASSLGKLGNQRALRALRDSLGRLPETATADRSAVELAIATIARTAAQ
jgi:HEAT repeat protein